LPGHSKSWQIAYPELGMISHQQNFGRENGELFAPPIDITKEETYEFLDLFFEEMADLFPDKYLHIGGDEVNPKYWEESESVQQFMKENNLHDTHDLQAYFNFRMHKILTKHGKKMVGWEEILHSDLGDDIVIQSWKSQKTLFEGVQRGGTAILSAGLYLDHKLHAGEHYKIDPLVMPGAVDITPDSSQWKMYDLVLKIPSGEMESQLVIFDRNNDDVFGFFAMMDDRMAFKNGNLDENKLTFKLKSPMGELDFSGEFIGDSVAGQLSFGFLKFDCNGSKSGGNDISGTVMPKIETIKPLTDEDKSRIVGGEAAMWSEVVGENNVESRIWPRSAAIAEKLWSPAELTTDTEDMYRRLENFSTYIEKRGSHHNLQKNAILEKLIEPEGLSHLQTLVNVLEEVKYYGRLGDVINSENLYLPDYPLDGVVDAARPESSEARNFNKLVDKYLSDKTKETLKNKIQVQLEIWSKNHELLKPYLNSDKLLQVSNISKEFSFVASKSLEIINNKSLSEKELEIVKEKLVFLENGENGMLLAVVPGLRKLCLEN
ncbi:MAG: family 20 glycosylhydrolase, partial [Draconibacterium sp.]|nr:family 20 glycosylhydrolase [Draconibacterium sp.]